MSSASRSSIPSLLMAASIPSTITSVHEHRRPPRPDISLVRRARPERGGTTVIELAIVLVLVSFLTAIAIPAVGRQRDVAAVRRATQSLTDALAVARDVALAGVAPVAVDLNADPASITVRSANDTIERHELGTALHATRDSMAYGPDGLGVGAANLTAILSRGMAAETVVVSRLGRVR